MNTLVLLAHPEASSFNAAMATAAARAREAVGDEVSLVDLNAIGFDPVARAEQFPHRQDTTFFALDREQEFAAPFGDVAEQQQLVAAADLLIVQFPMWWFGMPAIMKGWFERVFARGFAYQAGRKYDTGMFAGKRAMVSLTTGTSADTYAPDGIDGEMLDILWPIHNGILRYTGFDVYQPFITYMPRRMTSDERTEVVHSLASVVTNIESRPMLEFHRAHEYDERERLRPDVAIRSGFQHRS